MTKIRITKKFEFEAGHALYGYDGKCKNIHGHSYKLWVTVIGSPIEDPEHVKNGMVIDFGDIKEIVNEYIVKEADHTIFFNGNSPHRSLAEKLQAEGHRVILLPYQPTSEMLPSASNNTYQSILPYIAFAYRKLKAPLPSGMLLIIFNLLNLLCY